MTLVIEKGNYISRVWFFCRSGEPMDVLAHLTRRLPDGLWIFEYRFRYYNDDQAHDSTDRKNVYVCEIPATVAESEVVGKLAFCVAALEQYIGACDEVVVESDEPQLVAHLLRQKPWAFAKYQKPKS